MRPRPSSCWGRTRPSATGAGCAWGGGRSGWAAGGGEEASKAGVMPRLYASSPRSHVALVSGLAGHGRAPGRGGAGPSRVLACQVHGPARDEGGDRPAPQGLALPRRVLGLAPEPRALHGTLGLEVEDRDVGRGPWVEARRGPAHDACRPVLEQPQQALEGQLSRHDQARVQQRERDLEVRDAEGRAEHVLLLLGERVGRVVGADGVDRAARQRRPQSGHVVRGPERRRDLVDRVEAGEALVRQRAELRRDLHRGRGAAGLQPGRDAVTPPAATVHEVSVRCWGVTSPVTGAPLAFSQVATSSPRRELTCARWTRAPVRRATSPSRKIITASAASGLPGRPRRWLTAPSCMTPPSRNEGSSECVCTTSPSSAAYSQALRNRRESATGTPSSVTITAPAARSAAMSVSSSPLRPLLIAAAGRSLAPATRAARATRSATMPGSSTTGSVFAIDTTVPYPPAAAAARPEARSALTSWPGSGRWPWRSRSAGVTSRPSASTSWSTAPPRSSPSITPSLTYRSWTPRSPAPSSRRPPLSTSL